MSLPADLPLSPQSSPNKQQAYLLQSWTLLLGVLPPVPTCPLNVFHSGLPGSKVYFTFHLQTLL